MPEGHTIHRAARDHNRALAGRALRASSPQGRFAAGAARIDEAVLQGVDAWGKHLFYRFGADTTLHVHLGLFGRFWRWDPPAAGTHRQVRLRLEGPTVGYDLTGPTACELLDPAAVDAVLARLGPDPLRADADGPAVWPRLARRRGPIGTALMDQSLVAGVGNVYRAEALYVHGLHPERPCSTLDADMWDQLWATLVAMLRAGLRTGRIVTVGRDEPVPDRRTRWVYKQQTCARCGTPIRRFELAGRWAYACETCQPPWPAGHRGDTTPVPPVGGTACHDGGDADPGRAVSRRGRDPSRRAGR